jgi:predicted enzyme related to lactoylglutathione lyase
MEKEALMTTGIRTTHDFCWINLMTPQGGRAADFYAKLLGWTYGEMPGVPGGRIILVEGRAAGALMDLDTVKMPPGTPAVIGVLVRVDDADATSAKVKALGGSAEPVMDVMDNGRMGLCTDPNGAVFGIWQPKSKLGFEMDSRAHGAASWFETIAGDVPRAVGFYEGLFGWKHEEVSPVPGMTYTLFKLGQRPVAAAFKPVKGPDDPPHWATTFTVKDADEAARRARELGADVCFGPEGIPGVGRFALLKSPQGVSFNVLAPYRDAS